MSWREHRMDELMQIRTSDPMKLICMYRYLKGLGECNQLPYGVSFTSMIRAILDDEANQQSSQFLPVGKVEPAHSA
jgi:hypothetical protein